MKKLQFVILIFPAMFLSVRDWILGFISLSINKMIHAYIVQNSYSIYIHITNISVYSMFLKEGFDKHI